MNQPAETKPISQPKGLILKITIVWLSILLLLGFLITSRSTDSPVTLTILPAVPKEGEPVVATFNFNNPTETATKTDYQLYVNGRLVESGTVTVAPQGRIKHQYAYANPLQRGEQINFVLKTSSDSGPQERIVSLPPYPSQLMSSFVSFAAFSTSVMSSMISMEYFSSTFGTTSGLNTGIIISVILIALLIFLELTQTVTSGRGIRLLNSYRTGLGNISSILFIIFLGMIFTRVVMIVAT